jgi:hypothetical protein
MGRVTAGFHIKQLLFLASGAMRSVLLILTQFLRVKSQLYEISEHLTIELESSEYVELVLLPHCTTTHCPEPKSRCPKLYLVP